MNYKKRFPVITTELKSKIRTVTQALLELQTSKKLIKLLELILALGNYMNNNGNRGNAAGFRLNSLIRIQDTKSNYKISLMNYLISQIENCWPDLLDIEFELRNLRGGAKVKYVKHNTLIELPLCPQVLMKLFSFQHDRPRQGNVWTPNRYESDRKGG